MNIVTKMMKDMHKEQITKQYASKNRLIPQALYTKLKAQKKCAYCKKKLWKNEIHHIIAVIDCNCSEEFNLMAIHPKCHEILDRMYDEAKARNDIQGYLKRLKLSNAHITIIITKLLCKSDASEVGKNSISSSSSEHRINDGKGECDNNSKPSLVIKVIK